MGAGWGFIRVPMDSLTLGIREAEERITDLLLRGQLDLLPEPQSSKNLSLMKLLLKIICFGGVFPEYE